MVGASTGSPLPMPPPDQFRYDGFAIDPVAGTIDCSYSTRHHAFTESFAFGPRGDWDGPALVAAARLLFLLAGVSYYKTTASRIIDLGPHPTTKAERTFLRRFYVHGLAEFAHRNGLDLTSLDVVGPDAGQAAPVNYDPAPGRPLVPFGGGIDSIVTVDAIARDHPDTVLFVVHPPEQRFAAIDDAAAVTGLPVRHAARRIDPQVRRSAELGFLNGHVPVTAIVTAAAIVAAVLDGRDAVVLANEWSASVPTLVVEGRAVNHQWSKGDEFERDLGEQVAATFGPGLEVFSYLRPRTELWVGRRFAELTAFHDTFRSCNRAFHQDSAQRLDRWCGVCDKCCFIDLILAPYMGAATLAAVFGGAEPLDNPGNHARFRTLLGFEADTKPFECVGDEDECRAALRLTARREDRADAVLVQRLRAEIDAAFPAAGLDDGLLEPRGPHRIPDRYAPPDLLVRAR
jgi:UDP-N-acetyl-alpha-D-muramoyl-L-alanyl-L-glutamate epimerase